MPGAPGTRPGKCTLRSQVFSAVQLDFVQHHVAVFSPWGTKKSHTHIEILIALSSQPPRSIPKKVLVHYGSISVTCSLCFCEDWR